MKKNSWRKLSISLLVLGLAFVIIPMFNYKLAFLSILGFLMIFIGTAFLIYSFIVSEENDNIRQLEEGKTDNLHKKIMNSVGTVYVLIVALTPILSGYILTINKTLGYVVFITAPIIAAIILCSTNLKKYKKYVTQDNYPKIVKTVIYLMILIAIFGSIYNLILLLSYVISTIIILYYLKP